MAGGHLGTIWASVALDTAPLGAGAARARRQMYALDATLSQAAGGMGKKLVGIGLSAGIMAGVVAAASVKMAADFDEAIHKAGAVAEASQADMDAWGKSILDLSTKFAVPAKNMADALYWIKSDMPDATDAQQWDTLQVAIKGSVGGVAELSDATEALIVVQNAYTSSGVELQGPTDYMDAMTVAVQRGSLTLQDFVANMGKATGTAAMAKVPFTEIAAAAATLTRKGVPVETAFMALNQTMMTFLKPSAEASETAQQLGIDFTLTGLRAKGLAGSLMEIADKVPDEQLAELFPNIRALKAVLPLAGVSVEDFAKDLEAMGQRTGTTERMFGIMSDSIGYKISAVANRIKKSMIELGTSLFPVVEKLANAISNIFEGKNAVVNTFAGAIKTAGTAVWGLGSFLLTLKPIIIGVLGAFLAWKAISGVIGIVKGVGAAISATFPGIFTGAMTATTTAVLSIVAPVGIAAVALGTILYFADQNAKKIAKQTDAFIKTGNASADAGTKLQGLISTYQNLRDKADTSAEGQKALQDATNAVAAASPSLVESIDAQGNAFLKNDAQLKNYVSSLMAYSGVRVTTTGDTAQLEVLAGKIERTRNGITEMTATTETLRGALMRMGVNAGDTNGAIESLNRGYKEGKDSTLATMEVIRRSGDETKDQKVAYDQAKAALEQLGQQNRKYAMTLGEAIAGMGQMTAAAADMKKKLAEAARTSGLAGEELSTNIIEGLKSASPMFRSAAVYNMTQYMAGQLEMRGLGEEEAATTAENMARSLANGKPWETSGNVSAEEFYQAMTGKLAGSKGEIEAAGIATGEIVKGGVVAGADGTGAAVKEKIGIINIPSFLEPPSNTDGFISMVERMLGGIRIRPTIEAPAAPAGYTTPEFIPGEGGGRSTVAFVSDLTRLQRMYADFQKTMAGTNINWTVTNQANEIIGALGHVAEESGRNIDQVVGKWNTMNTQLAKVNATLKSQEAAIEASDKKIEAYQRRLDQVTNGVKGWTDANGKNHKSLEALTAIQERLTNMKMKGETAADDKSFAQQQKLNEIQLAILKAKEAHQYGQAALLQREFDQLTKEKEIADLQTQVDYEPARREIEKALDPMKDQEYTAEQILGWSKATTAEIALATAERDRLQTAIAVERDRTYELRQAYQATTQAVNELSQAIDEMGRNAVARWEEMKRAFEEAARAQPGGASGAGSYALGGPVLSTGMAMVHAGEFVLSRAMLRQMSSPKLVMFDRSSSSQTVHVPVYLDGKVIAKSTARIMGKQSNAYSRSGGSY